MATNCIFFITVITFSLIPCIDSYYATCHTKYTNADQDGRGHSAFLDRHHLNCGEGLVLSSFKLKRIGSRFLGVTHYNDYQYVYKCCFLNYQCRNTPTYNPFTNSGEGKAVYLDRQIVQCHNQFLSSFELKRIGNTHRYVYNCCVSQRSLQCYDTYTQWTTSSSSTTFLDRQTVACGHTAGLASFQLQRNSGHTHWRYHYRCCKFVM